MMGFGYEGTTANSCMYHPAILNAFKPQNFRLLCNLMEIPEKLQYPPTNRCINLFGNPVNSRLGQAV